MRIPIPIAIVVCIITAGAVWKITTKTTDLITPPTAEEKAEARNQWLKENSPTTELDQKEVAAEQIETIDSPAQPPIELPTPEHVLAFEIGDLHKSPKLSEYGNLGSQGAPAIILMAKELEKRQATQRALLAWERVLDTTTPSYEEVKEAGAAIERLKKLLPPWNPDPTAEIPITLHASATIKNSKALEDTLGATAKLISEASGRTLRVTPQTIIRTGIKSKTPRTPVAIWFSTPTKSKQPKGGETPPLSFLIDPDQPDILSSQCQAAVYALLKTHLAKTTNYSLLPVYPSGVMSDQLLKYYVSRLMWHEFANSLK